MSVWTRNIVVVLFGLAAVGCAAKTQTVVVSVKTDRPAAALKN